MVRYSHVTRQCGFGGVTLSQVTRSSGMVMFSPVLYCKGVVQPSVVESSGV